MPRVSVVVPSFNHADFVGEAMESVYAQTLGDLELIVVDDGSRDDSRRRIEDRPDARLVTHFQENQGAHAAINRGIELSADSSEYIAILNSDDVYRPRWLERAVARLDADPEAGFCAGRLEFPGDEDGDKRRWYAAAMEYYLQSGDVVRSLVHRNFIMTTSNVVLRKSVLETTGLFRPLRYVHDVDLFLRLASVSRFAFLDEVQVHYRIHAANTIAEGEQSARIVFEFAWVLVGRLWREYASPGRPAELFRNFADLTAALDIPEVASAALALFPLRADLDRHNASEAEIEDFWLALLEPGNPILEGVVHSPRDRFSPCVQAMKMEIGRLQHDLDAQREGYERRLRQLQQSGRYRLGQAFDEARDLRGLVELPAKVLRAVRPTGGVQH